MVSDWRRRCSPRWRRAGISTKACARSSRSARRRSRESEETDVKIGVVHVTAEEVSVPYTELITANFERAKSDGTEILHRYVRHLRRATDTAIAYPTLLNKVDVIAEMVDLERAGADAVFVACSGDTGVAEARSLLRIPVVGP